MNILEEEVIDSGSGGIIKGFMERVIFTLGFKGTIGISQVGNMSR